MSSNFQSTMEELNDPDYTIEDQATEAHNILKNLIITKGQNCNMKSFKSCKTCPIGSFECLGYTNTNRYQAAIRLFPDQSELLEILL